MKDSMLKKCTKCRYACKTDELKDCKFEPKNEYFGNKLHFTDPKPWVKHDKVSRMCVVCKDWFGYKNIKWASEKEGYYPMCLECFENHQFILQMRRNRAQ